MHLAKEHGLSLTGPDRLLEQFIKTVLEPVASKRGDDRESRARQESGHAGSGINEYRQRHSVVDGADRLDRARPD